MNSAVSPSPTLIIAPFADLRHVDLRGADLEGVNLAGADLCGAILTGACFLRANLAGANLAGADLEGANLRYADLTGAILPDGRTLSKYMAWLPEGLLKQGGKTLREVIAAWDNHTWIDCPMSVAFDASSLEQIPGCFRASAALFLALFDGGHLPESGLRC